MADNICLQREELEVLDSIFQDQWKRCPVVHDRYTMKIGKDVELSITLNKFYPSYKPPEYDIWAPYLNQCQKRKIAEEFQKIYSENHGGPIIFQWIDMLKIIMESQDFKTKKQTKKTRSTNLIQTDSKKINFNVVHGPSITEKKSTFQGHVCKITEVSQVKNFVTGLCENHKIANAKHNILAYRIASAKNLIIENFDNDGEKHGADPLMHLLRVLKLTNIAVVVTRWYGGVHLGSDRFRCIKDAAQQALISGGFIDN